MLNSQHDDGSPMFDKATRDTLVSYRETMTANEFINFLHDKVSQVRIAKEQIELNKAGNQGFKEDLEDIYGDKKPSPQAKPQAEPQQEQDGLGFDIF